MPRGPRAAAIPRPELGPKEWAEARRMTKSTFAFWQATDKWPVYDQPHKQMFGIFDSAGPDMSRLRRKPLSSMFLAPRFSNKTYGVAKSIARRVLENPDISIGIFRSTREEARKLLRLVQNILRSPKVVHYFGDPYFGAEVWNQDAIVIPWRTISRADPTVFTMGTSGTSTGNHPDFIYGDDLVTEVNCDSIKEQENLWSYIEAFDPQLPSWGAVLLTGTRWSEIDCYGRIENLNEAARRSGVAENDLPWQSYVFEAKWQVADGSWQYYFPDYLDEERLESMRLKTDVRRFNAWMYNRMVDPAEKPFKPQNIHKFSGKYEFSYPYKRTLTLLDPQYAGEKVRLYVALIVDPALTDETGSCGYGLTVTGFARDRRQFTLESRERVLLPSRALEIIKQMLLTYRPNRVVIESAGGDAWLIVEIGKFIQKEALDCVVQPFSALQHEKSGHRAKHQRIRRMETYVSSDQCFFRMADDPSQVDHYGGYCYDLLQQIDKWPSLIRNDAIDSWAMGHYVLPFVPADEGDFQEDLPTANPPEWDMSWTDSDGNVHGLSADKVSRLAMGPPPGADAARWLETLEFGSDPGTYRPGSATRSYLQRRKRAG